MIKRTTLLFLYILTTLLFLFDNAQSQIYNGTCEGLDQISKPAYTSWPFTVDCKKLRNIWDERQEKTDQDDIECELTYYNGSVVDEGIQELTSVDDNALYIAKLIINGTVCISNEIKIELQAFPEENCLQSVNRSASMGHVIFKESTSGDSVDLECISPEGTPDVIPEGSDKNQFSTRWFVECEDQEYRTNNAWAELDNPGYPNSLSMPRVDFWDAADFTCTVKYKGRRLFVVTYSQCIKQRTEQTKPTLTCTREKTVAPGFNTMLECTGQIVLGLTSPEDLSILWKKSEKDICKNQHFNRTSQGLNYRQSCIVQGNNDSLICETDGDALNDNEVQKERKSIVMQLLLSDVQSTDYGNYEIELGFQDRKTGVWKSDSWTINLIQDMTPFYEKLIIIFSILLSVFCFLVILYIIFRKFKIYFLLLYKRSSLWKYDKDDKQYVAYLSYMYDSESMTEEDLRATKKVVFTIHKLFEDNRFKFYDEQHEPDFSVQVENLTNMVDKCHRMIFVLSPKYLEDRWTRFRAELGFHGLLEARMGLIFILLPGVKKQLKRLAVKDDVWKGLLRAIKVNPVIEWNAKMSDEELKDNVDYHLPKLNRPGNPEYLRTLSQTTTCTEVSEVA